MVSISFDRSLYGELCRVAYASTRDFLRSRRGNRCQVRSDVEYASILRADLAQLLSKAALPVQDIGCPAVLSDFPHPESRHAGQCGIVAVPVPDLEVMA